MMQHTPTRRHVLALAAALLRPGAAGAQGRAIAVYRDPSCGCCGGWIAHLRRSGFTVSVDETSELSAVKDRLAVPEELHACHTAQVASYVVEGHVPAHALERLLAEKPKLAGLAVPGMPVGSPGMEGGPPEVYEVIGFEGPRRVGYGRYRGASPV